MRTTNSFRLILLPAMLCGALTAAAQSPPDPSADSQAPARKQNNFLIMAPADGVETREVPRVEGPSGARGVFVDSAGARQLQQETEQRNQKLRERLADPKQRAQVRAERIQEVSTRNPDLARVLQLDARTAEQLLSLLADQRISQELGSNPLMMAGRMSSNENSMLPAALEYNQRMSEIQQVIGSKALDDYVAYQESVQQRQSVDELNTALPGAAKLTGKQKDALVSLLQESERRRLENMARNPPGLRGFTDFFSKPREELARSLKVRNITSNEAEALRKETENRELQQRVVQILSPEQAKAFAAQRQADIDSLRAWTQEQRRALGVGPDQPLELPDDQASATRPELTETCNSSSTCKSMKRPSSRP